MNPKDFLRMTTNYAKSIVESKSSYVAVGLPTESATGKIYPKGQTVIEIGAHHEFGTDDIPQRSFLKLPFELKQDEIGKLTKALYSDVLTGKKSVEKALATIGIKAQNISVDAFRSNGYGSWEPVQHGGTPLIDTGTLRNSISYVVRKK